MDTRVLTYEYSAGAEQAPIFLDEFVGEFRGVQLEPIPVGVGYVQTTLSTREAVQDGQAAWVTWAAGSVSANTHSDIKNYATALRVVRTSGGLRLNVRII